MEKLTKAFFFPQKKDLRKILLIMRLVVILLIFGMSQISANVYSQKQKVSFKFENISLQELIWEIQKQTDFVFMYGEEDIRNVRNLSVEAIESDAVSVLRECIEGSDIEIEVVDEVVVVMKKRVLLEEQMEASAIEIKGKVTDKDGEPLPGTTILELGTMNGVTADANGEYKLTVNNAKSKLKFSFVGFETQLIEVKDQKVINVVLKETATSLDEVVITGYQDIPKVRSTGSVSKVTATEIKESGAVTVDQVLRGKMSGALTMNVSGRPGATARIRIRGLNSITGDMNPIWIVDGMEMKEAVPNISVGGVNLQNSILTNGIGAIAPEDIASITVLKDAAASALYGARAANGVIVVTTKKGNAGDNRISITSSFSLSEAPSNHLDMMNSAEKIQFEREWFEDRPIVNASGRVSLILGDVFLGKISKEDGEAQIAELAKNDTDWFDVIFRPAYSWRHNINFSGGTQKMQYYASASLSEEKGILKGNKLNSFNTTAKLAFNPIPNLRIESQLRASIRKDLAPNPVEDPFAYATFANPYEKPYNEDGSYAADRSYNQERNHIDLLQYIFDYNILEDMETSSTLNKVSSISFDTKISYDIIKNLSVESQMQYTNSTSYGKDWAAPGSYASYKRNVLHNSGIRYLPDELNNGYLRETHGGSESYTFKNLIKYNANINEKHFVNVLLGQEASKTDANNFFNLLPEYNPVYRTGSYTGELDPNIFANWANTEITFDSYNFESLGNTGISENRSVSFFGNATYSYKDIYVLNSSLRFDGVDIIGSDNNYTPLWNISGKWNIHRENFMQDVSFVDVLSLRVSYGYTGSIDRNSLPFTYLRYHIIDYYADAITPTQINWKNPSVKWEKKLDRNLGFNASLFKNRLNIGFNYFTNRVVDLLDNKQLPVSVGDYSITANVASLTNTGFEIDLSTVVVAKGDWRWTLSFNLSQYRNRVTDTYYQNIADLPLIEKSSGVGATSKYYTVGYDASAIFGYQFAGVDPITGNSLIYVNNEEHLNEWEIHSEINGRKVIDMDRYFNHEATVAYLGKSVPSLYGGFGTMLSYKSFRLTAQFSYVSGNIIKSPSTTYIYDMRKNVLRRAANRWRQPGDVTDIPEIIVRGNSGMGYNKYLLDTDYENGAYLKLTYINFSYDLPRSFIKKLGMQKCRFSINANNLFTWTEYKGIDPEKGGGFGYPSPRKYTASLEITF